MPLVAHHSLPTYQRLQSDGMQVLPPDRAVSQDVRELHIGLLNMMPDAALEATERQFFRLVGESNPVAQIYVYPFTLPEIPRGEKAQAHIDQYYQTFEQLKLEGLDALIVTGATVNFSELSQEIFWQPLRAVLAWAWEHSCSVLCSCLATHAVMQACYQQKRQALSDKCWGVYPHRVVQNNHPLVWDMNTVLDVPHSRFNQIHADQYRSAGLHILIAGDQGVHLATSPDGFRLILFQGHPEYDTISLLKEYKREVGQYIQGKRKAYPPFPENYLGLQSQAILMEYRDQLEAALEQNRELPVFPEHLIVPYLDNTWHDSAEAIVNNWIGQVYQVTHVDRKKQYMDSVDPLDPLGWLSRTE